MRLASPRLRLLAALVDVAAFLGVIAAFVGLVIAAVVGYERLRRDERDSDADEQDEPDGDEQDEPDDYEQDEPDDYEQDEPSDAQRATGEFRPSRELRAALWGASMGVAVAGRNGRGPGFRVFGLRRVDARTGGIVSVRSALIGVCFDQARQAATRQLFRSRARGRRDRVSALGPQLSAVLREHAADPEARERAMKEFYKANDVKPFAGCGWQLAGAVASQLVLALGSRGGRTVRDRITGTSVIAEK
jgi:hypothetical protein